jgi:hypothetical protein
LYRHMLSHCGRRDYGVKHIHLVVHRNLPGYSLEFPSYSSGPLAIVPKCFHADGFADGIYINKQWLLFLLDFHTWGEAHLMKCAGCSLIHADRIAIAALSCSSSIQYTVAPSFGTMVRRRWQDHRDRATCDDNLTPPRPRNPNPLNSNSRRLRPLGRLPRAPRRSPDAPLRLQRPRQSASCASGRYASRFRPATYS